MTMWSFGKFYGPEMEYLIFKGDVKVNVVALNRHDKETTSQK